MKRWCWLALSVSAVNAGVANLGCGGADEGDLEPGDGAGATANETGAVSNGGGPVTGSGATASSGATSSGGSSYSGEAAGGYGAIDAGGYGAGGDAGGTTSNGGTTAGGGTTATGGTSSTGGSTGNGVCVDIYPFTDGFTCAQQAGWGKCGETWLADYCDVSCGRCTPSTGTGGSPGAGGAGSTTCAVEPVNPNATPQVRKLLCYLYGINGKNVLSGQQETSWDKPEDDISFYVNNVGKSPAILGGDYLYPSGTSTRAIAYFKAGGITMIRYHMGAPPDADSYQSSLTSTNLSNVLTAGTTENKSYLSKLDYAAVELQKLEDANVAVIFAPLHEYQPGGWFWWSKGTAAQFIDLWKLTFNYLTTTKGLNNLLWLAPSSGNISANWFPGKAYSDIAGPDTYDTNPPFGGIYNNVKAVVGSNVPIPLHETGMIPQPSTMFPSTAPWVLWNVWAGYQKDTSKNQLDAIKSAYASPYTLTRDELPNLQ